MQSFRKHPTLLIFSGRKGAGKDTVAPLVVDRLDISNARHMSFADPLKDEVDQIIKAIHQSKNKAEAEKNLLDIDPEMPLGIRGQMVTLFKNVLNHGEYDHSRSHSAAAVTALQVYGTQYKRAKDPDHWVKKAVKAVEEAMSAGVTPYFTDARFPNEVDALKELGGAAVRLNVSAEGQERRLLLRDGRAPNREELEHVSETALDDYEDFDVVVETRDLVSTVNTVVHELSELQ